ncbi:MULTISPECIES: serine hydrolase domain-containing protein [Aeribacillus]|uniref:serine hydrolase domain-containing protein n=1 Tax=Aeribacillus TaxID=1055323 RepID=UPI0007B4732F|nr:MULTISPECIES: serine hydrolase domain-containing protein [Aeribacillus]KZM56053.1 1,4-butanediol diacrylate esterase [Aeribacillus pallidus]MED0650760.1 serine hydrolase [Aeribacillus composti]MED0714987.1 serine hydrolase [Aeribacillus composti]MED0747013.1 serine hydrolase [Aeribacillus composti]MED4487940.1 serine hydrolase [Aeribacillus pallidus]
MTRQAVKDALKETLDKVLDTAVGRAGGAPGVVAMVTDRDGNIYEGAAGVRDLGKKTPMTTDTVFALFSTTKAITGTALMKLVEEGKVSLDDPVKKYVPEIAEIPVLEGFDKDGQPKLREAKTDVTINMLMLHTAGFGYEFFSHEDRKYREAKGVPSILTSTFDSVKSVLLFEPGERWNYGVNIDWVGKVVEAVSGKRLGEVMAERIFAPLGMSDIGFTLSPSMMERRATIHSRSQDGQLTPKPELILPQSPEMDMGGHGLYASIGEYTKFIRMILNDGAGVLKPETVAQMSQNGLGELKSGGWISSDPTLANDGEFYPGVQKSWSYTFQVNDEPTPTGRPAGQLMWSGLANLFYWIDHKNGIGGYWATQIFPFQDVGSYLGFLEFESAVYSTLKRFGQITT